MNADNKVPTRLSRHPTSAATLSSVSPYRHNHSHVSSAVIPSKPVDDCTLIGKKEEIRVMDAMQEMIMSNIESHKAVKAMKEISHIPSAPVIRQNESVKESFKRAKELRNRRLVIPGLLKMSCFRAVEKAYKNREKLELTMQRAETVSNLRENTIEGLQRTKTFLELRNKDIIRQSKEETITRVTQTQQHSDKEKEVVETNKEKQMRRRKLLEESKASSAFVREFSIRNTSISNALRRHDLRSYKLDRQRARDLLTSAHRENTLQIRNEIKMYMKVKVAKKQMEIAAERTHLDTLLKSNSDKRQLEANARVAELRAVRAITLISPRSELLVQPPQQLVNAN